MPLVKIYDDRLVNAKTPIGDKIQLYLTGLQDTSTGNFTVICRPGRGCSDAQLRDAAGLITGALKNQIPAEKLCYIERTKENSFYEVVHKNLGRGPEASRFPVPEHEKNVRSGPYSQQDIEKRIGPHKLATLAQESPSLSKERFEGKVKSIVEETRQELAELKIKDQLMVESQKQTIIKKVSR